METESILNHMNEHHHSELVGLLKKFGQLHEPKNVKLTKVDMLGLDISYNEGKSLRIEFPQKVTDPKDGLKNAIIELCQSVPKTLDTVSVKKEIEDFIKGMNTIIISSLNSSGEVVCSYAPLLKCEGKYYIYVSEVAEHYGSLRENPDNLEIMFIEDESKAKSVILRKRLRYRARAKFIERGSEFDKIFDSFIGEVGESGGIKTIRDMMDFHLIHLEFLKGRFVKGFGQAYDIINGEISYIGGAGNPHKIKK
ncbi:HugZ family heme oxygenase [Helicobacter cappadocius]|uniref:HugZ family heme oxygenase n=1 Tax=Helicobacter cappadocius TaxID=3063998 RepID=A0AA90TE53_9HELI|nr:MULTISPECIES: HugZ family heme oxygenase [unclassified Helicobacter]MDO7252443.1 HugZ family heme oxygenase [Helicobacter sp. faydin-H75]MDP2538310.1 HugZ family heme oxygenase [Helicobacter sp. faydin-H76]